MSLPLGVHAAPSSPRRAGRCGVTGQQCRLVSGKGAERTSKVFVTLTREEMQYYPQVHQCPRVWATLWLFSVWKALSHSRPFGQPSSASSRSPHSPSWPGKASLVSPALCPFQQSKPRWSGEAAPHQEEHSQSPQLLLDREVRALEGPPSSLLPWLHPRWTGLGATTPHRLSTILWALPPPLQ